MENVRNSTQHHCERLKIICWNINGGFSTKINDQCFQNFLLTYDIVLLTECWVQKDLDVNLDKFDTYIFPRLKSRSTQGGGIVVLIRKKFHNFISVVKNQHDTVIWLKIQNLLKNIDKDLYVGCAYIPPSNSTFYRLYDCDLFSDLETQISTFQNEGKVMLLGDLNARTSNREDFIVNDVMHESNLNYMETIGYEMDSDLPSRAILFGETHSLYLQKTTQ